MRYFPYGSIALFLLGFIACAREEAPVKNLASSGAESVPVVALPEELADFARTGAKRLPDEDYLRLERAKMARSFAGQGEKPYAALPPRTDLSEEMPEAGNQGGQGSCAGWAVGYAVKSFQENREHGWGFRPSHLFSPAFLYNLANGGTDEGAYMTDVLEILKNTGVVPLTHMPYREGDFTTQPPEDVKKFAGGFRALDYRRLEEPDVNVIKSYLASGDPVVLELALYRNFNAAGMHRSGDVYREGLGDRLGYHFITAVGYDDARGALRLMNSWGKSWGENGFGWLDYAFAPKAVERAYVVYDIPTPRETVAALDGEAPVFAGDEGEDSGRVAALSESPDTPKAAASEHTEPLLIVPGEAGVSYGGRWLRLAETLDRTREFFSEKTSPAFAGWREDGDDPRAEEALLEKGSLGALHFFSDKRVSVFTDLGVTFRTPREVVRRIYRKPDLTVNAGGDDADTYFYHAISRDWGGIRLTTHLALTFHYAGDGSVDYISLASVFKDVMTGKAESSLDPGEGRVASVGLEIVSPEGGVNFTVPARFSGIKKSVWEGTGVGYFLTDPATNDSLAVKIFKTSADAATVLEERIAADEKVFVAELSRDRGTRVLNGAAWFSRGDTRATHLRFYTANSDRIVQVHLASAGGMEGAAWVEELLGSFRFR